jgi:hypothetical protein
MKPSTSGNGGGVYLMFGGFRGDGCACGDAWLLNTDADQVCDTAAFFFVNFVFVLRQLLGQDKPALTPTPPLTFRNIPPRSLVPLGGRGGAAAAFVGLSSGLRALLVMGGGVGSSGRMIGARVRGGCVRRKNAMLLLIVVSLFKFPRPDFDFTHPFSALPPPPLTPFCKSVLFLFPLCSYLPPHRNRPW